MLASLLCCFYLNVSHLIHIIYIFQGPRPGGYGGPPQIMSGGPQRGMMPGPHGGMPPHPYAGLFRVWSLNLLEFLAF